MKQLLTFVLLFASATILVGQMPKAINYQAVARNSTGQLTANQTIKVRLSIVNTAASNAVVYSETRQTTTNAVGLFNIQFGSPGAISTTGTFDDINWVNNTTSVENLKVELDVNNNNTFVDMGSQGLMTVPYAFASDQAINAVNIGGHYVDTNTPNPGDILKWTGSSWAPKRSPQVVSINVHQGVAVNGSSLVFAWAHTPVTVTLNEGETISATISAILGSNSGAATSVGMNVAYQASGGQIIPFYTTSYLTVASISARQLFTVAGTKRVGPAGTPASDDTIPAGTYSIGFAVRNVSPTSLNSNDAINGFILIQ